MRGKDRTWASAWTPKASAATTSHPHRGRAHITGLGEEGTEKGPGDLVLCAVRGTVPEPKPGGPQALGTRRARLPVHRTHCCVLHACVADTFPYTPRARAEFRESQQRVYTALGAWEMLEEREMMEKLARVFSKSTPRAPAFSKLLERVPQDLFSWIKKSLEKVQLPADPRLQSGSPTPLARSIWGTNSTSGLGCLGR